MMILKAKEDKKKEDEIEIPQAEKKQEPEVDKRIDTHGSPLIKKC